MRILCVFAKYNYGDMSRGVSIDYESFVSAFLNMGHEVRHFDAWDKCSSPTYEDLNRTLLKLVLEFDPDVVFTVQRDYEIWLESLAVIRANFRAVLMTWMTDDSFKFHKVSKYIAPYYDGVSTTYAYRIPDYKRFGVDEVHLTQWAANSHWLKRPKLARDCRYKVSFVGACYGERAGMIERLTAAGISVDCFGYGWPNGPVATEQIPEIMRDSQISLNFSSGFQKASGNKMQIKARIFEVPGAGGFLLTDFLPELHLYYELGKEIETYKSFDELADKTRYYLQHPDRRDQLALAGYQKTAESHTYEQRLDAFLKFSIPRRELRRAVGAVSTDSPVSLQYHPPGVVLRLLRTLLVASCSMVWGRVRGPKAARRLVFSISRRLLGARTFTAASLPGRLFPYI